MDRAQGPAGVAGQAQERARRHLHRPRGVAGPRAPPPRGPAQPAHAARHHLVRAAAHPGRRPRAVRQGPARSRLPRLLHCRLLVPPPEHHRVPHPPPREPARPPYRGQDHPLHGAGLRRRLLLRLGRVRPLRHVPPAVVVVPDGAFLARLPALAHGRRAQELLPPPVLVLAAADDHPRHGPREASHRLCRARHPPHRHSLARRLVLHDQSDADRHGRLCLDGPARHLPRLLQVPQLPRPAAHERSQLCLLPRRVALHAALPQPQDPVVRLARVRPDPGGDAQLDLGAVGPQGVVALLRVRDGRDPELDEVPDLCADPRAPARQRLLVVPHLAHPRAHRPRHQGERRARGGGGPCRGGGAQAEGAVRGARGEGARVRGVIMGALAEEGARGMHQLAVLIMRRLPRPSLPRSRGVSGTSTRSAPAVLSLLCLLAQVSSYVALPRHLSVPQRKPWRRPGSGLRLFPFGKGAPLANSWNVDGKRADAWWYKYRKRGHDK